MWIREDYAGEAAVLFTWIAALVPWSVTILDFEGVLAVWIRFVPFRFLYVFGLATPDERPFRWFWEVPGFVGTRGETLAAYAWIVGVAVLAVAVALSLVYYADEDRVESWPLDPVRVLGGLLVLAGLVFAVATGVLLLHQSRATIPFGAVFLLAFGAILLTKVERSPGSPDEV